MTHIGPGINNVQSNNCLQQHSLHVQQNFENILPISLQLLLMHVVQCSCIMSAEVTQQLFILDAAIKKGCCTTTAAVLCSTTYIEGTSPTPRGTTFLTVYTTYT